ncbi:unnamed protein product [Brassicogethes aeneus]|uniref:Dynein regulatory complex subunit 2 n=1 Tax=Brassicogethes aeneus TaxID=1431903 RepID=A0A9P0B0L9_BRAAE|nr:unnamed protein product [Brassicogethes aeneus]
MVKLTPEEKKAKKAEKKLAAIEKKRQLKRDALEREIKFGDLTLKRHEKEWREMLIKIALPRMRNELEFAWHNFERVVDCKDFTISLLMDEIKDAKEQYMANFRNHIESLDKLIRMFHDRLRELKRDNKKQIEYLEEEDQKELQATQDLAADGTIYLKTMLYTLELNRRAQVEVENVEYCAKLDEEEQKTTEKVTTLKGVLENKYNNMWKETKNFIDEYNERVGGRKREYKVLKEQDDYLQAMQAIDVEKMFKLVEYIKKLRHKYKVLESTIGERINDLTGEHKFYFDAFMALKKKLELDRKKDFEQLTVLALDFNKIKTYLKAAVVKGSHILELASTCRQLETLEEKILPFPVPLPDEALKYKLPDIDSPMYNKRLFLFWQRVGQVDASRYAINEECEFLKLENEILRLKIHKFCMCLSCKRGPLITYGDNTKKN